MEHLHNGFTLELSPGAFPLSTDSVALSGFVSLPKKAAVLDLGSGCGTLGLLLCARFPQCTVTGVELDESAHAMALHNARVNDLEDRLTSICADLTAIPSLVPPGSYTCCISNPPYFAAGPQSKAHPTARQEVHCTLEDVFRSAGWALRYGGDFYLVHRPERFAEACSCASRHGMEVKKVCLLRHKPHDPISLTLLSCRKGGKPGLNWEEMCLFREDGTPTDDYRRLYHL